MKRNWKKRLAGGLSLLALLASPVGAEVGNLEAFTHLPVLHEGRVMPLDSFARQRLLLLSGKSTFQRQPATAWLARTLFTPEDAAADELFLVNHAEVAEAIGLPPATGRQRYAYAELEPVLPRLEHLARMAFKLEQHSRTPVEEELVRLYNSAVLYFHLRNALDFLRPLPDFSIPDPDLRQALQLEEGAPPLRLLDLLDRRAALARLAQENQATPADQRTPFQQELYRVVNVINARLRAVGPAGPALLPPAGHGRTTWLTPAEALLFTAEQTPLRDELAALDHLAKAFREGRQVDFDLSVRTLFGSITERLPPGTTNRSLKREVRYNRLQPFYRAELLYGLAFLAILGSIISPRRGWYAAACALVVLALVPHTYGILARMQIMNRPPVTNLYSTFVFVGWASALIGLVLEYVQRNRLGFLTASFSGLALLLVSGRFATEGDSMGVMVAVLDSNFWLATHVVCISLGYAGCCVAGLLGHVYLIQALSRPEGDPRLQETYGTVYGTLAFGLIFSFLGTMLGGIWADQSWGRFWGWDPKENGALVIVLWAAIIFHARIAHMIGPRGFSAGAVIGVIWVMLAWLGVNLLGVGLHSYGFTSNLAKTLTVVCVLEGVFVAATVPFSKKAIT